MGSRNPIFDLGKRGWAKTSKPAAKPSSKLAAAAPTVDALASAAYEAADASFSHLDLCGSCFVVPCRKGQALRNDYATKKAAALKAIRRHEAITQMINGEAVPPKASPSSPSPTRRKGAARG